MYSCIGFGDGYPDATSPLLLVGVDLKVILIENVVELSSKSYFSKASSGVIHSSEKGCQGEYAEH